MIDVVLFVILYDFSYFAEAAVIHLNSDLDSERLLLGSVHVTMLKMATSSLLIQEPYRTCGPFFWARVAWLVASGR